MADQAAFGFCNSVSKDVTWLTFEMSSTDIARRWAQCVLRETRKAGLRATLVGALYVDEGIARQEIVRLCAELNKKKPDKAWPPKLSPYVEKPVLQTLSNFCRTILSDSTETYSVRSLARELEAKVRHYMTIYQTDVHFHISLQRPLPWLVALKPADFSLFEADRRDGWLYLEYPMMGLSSLAAYLSGSAIGIEPQRMFCSNCEIVYREDYAYGPKLDEMRRWVAQARGTVIDDPRLAIGMIPLGRPTHGLSRDQVRELAQASEPELHFVYRSAGKEMTARDLGKMQSTMKGSSLGDVVNIVWANRIQLRKARFEVIRIWGERWRVGLFFFNLFNRFVLEYYYAAIMTFHKWRPVVVAWAHRMTWPVRKIYYFTSYQFRKRILKRP